MRLIGKHFFWFLKRATRTTAREVRAGYRVARGWIRFLRRYIAYRGQAPEDRQPRVEDLFPCLLDDVSETPVDAIYVLQDAWAFRRIARAAPATHLDIGSHHKFVSLLAQVLPVTMVDIRPLPLEVEGLRFKEGSILDLPFEDRTIGSLSCLCVLEHIGLGRYGDPLDPFGTEKAIEELKRILAPQGDMYLSIPINDRNIVYYDAHRAFEEGYLMGLFDPLEIVESRYIYEGTLRETRSEGFGVGCYHLRGTGRPAP